LDLKCNWRYRVRFFRWMGKTPGQNGWHWGSIVCRGCIYPAEQIISYTTHHWFCLTRQQ